MSLAIRRATVADAEMLSALAMRTFYDTFTGTCTEEDMGHFLNQYYNAAQITRELADPNDHIYLMMNGEQAAGYIRFGVNEVPFDYNKNLKALELNRLYVDKDYKGKGIGRKLTDLYENYGRDHGYKLLWLGVWEHNYAAQKFYAANGYAYTGVDHPFPIYKTPQTDQWWAKVIE